MKRFFKDLWEAQMVSFNFVKKHPIGYAVFCISCGVISAIGSAIYWYRKEIGNRIKTAFHKLIK